MLDNSSGTDEIVDLGKGNSPSKPIVFLEPEVTFRPSLLGLLGTLLFFIAPTVCLAQGWFPWFDSLPLLSAQPKIFIGRMSSTRPTTFSIHTPGGFHIGGLEQSVNTQGSWAELVVPIQGPIPIGFALSTAYLFPSDDRSKETYHTAAGVEERMWNTSTQMFNVQVSVSYRFSPLLAGILGFRYDSFMTDYAEPETLTQNQLAFDLAHKATLTVTGDIPFAGLMIDGNFGAGLNVRAGAIGLPALPGDISYKEAVGTNSGRGIVLTKEFRRGYFVEAFGEISGPIYRRVQGGAFVKYSSIFGKATKATLGSGGTTTTATVDANLIFDRSSLIVGGTIGVSF